MWNAKKSEIGSQDVPDVLSRGQFWRLKGSINIQGVSIVNEGDSFDPQGESFGLKGTALTLKGTVLTLKGTVLTLKGIVLTLKGTVLTQFWPSRGGSRSLGSCNWIHKVLELDPKGFGVKHSNSRHFVIMFIF